MKVKFIFLSLLLICLTSCKVISIGQEGAYELSSNPSLGSIGLFKDDFISSEFKTVGQPEFDNKVKISVERSYFNKQSINQYNNKIQDKTQELKIVDSLDLKPSYLKLEISDVVGLISILNDSKNKDLRSYLKSNNKEVMLTSIWIYFPEILATTISNAKEIYLINNATSSYSLEVLNNDNSKAIIEFNEGVSFGYDFSAFCWKENFRHYVVIAAIREINKPCAGSTKKNPEKIASKDLFEKL